MGSFCGKKVKDDGGFEAMVGEDDEQEEVGGTTCEMVGMPFSSMRDSIRCSDFGLRKLRIEVLRELGKWW